MVLALNPSHKCLVSDQLLYISKSAQLRPADNVREVLLRLLLLLAPSIAAQSLPKLITMKRTFSSGMLVFLLRPHYYAEQSMAAHSEHMNMHPLELSKMSAGICKLIVLAKCLVNSHFTVPKTYMLLASAFRTSHVIEPQISLSQPACMRCQRASCMACTVIWPPHNI